VKVPTAAPSATTHAIRAGATDANPRSVRLPALIAEDFRTNGSDLTSPGFWALAVHRFGNWRMGIPFRPLRAPATIVYNAAYIGVRTLWGIDLPYNVKVGRRLRIDHHGVLLMGACEIGDDVRVRNHVTLGLRRLNENAFPTIGDRVELGPGACVTGPIHIGSDSTVCGNSVPLRDVAPGKVVAGSPAVAIDLAAESRSDPR
jgi:serine O-acetyltransferase